MQSQRIAHVAIAETAFHFDKSYDYLLPPDMAGQISPGCRVLVPFGKGNRKRQGVILSIDGESELDRLKPITAALDKTPPFSEEMLRLGEWLKENTFCT